MAAKGSLLEGPSQGPLAGIDSRRQQRKLIHVSILTESYVR